MEKKDDKIKELEAQIKLLQAELAKERAKTRNTKKGNAKKIKDEPKKVTKKGSATKVRKAPKDDAPVTTKVNDDPKSKTNKKGATKTGKKVTKTTDGIEFKLKTDVGPRFNMLKEIKASPLYGKTKRDPIARKFLTENYKQHSRNKFVPGQLVLFDYLEPKTEEELEYYDAQPCTIFFNVVETSQGKRYLGFNIHYYPPELRYQIMNKIFELFRGPYVKYFTTGNDSAMDAFTYNILIRQLDKANLGFGVRMYIPELVTSPYQVPSNAWPVAVFTEGKFMKKTRTQIMSFWRKWIAGKKANSPAAQTKSKPRAKKK